MRIKKNLVFAVIAVVLFLALLSWSVFVALTTPPDPQVMYFPTRNNSMQTEVGYVWNSLPPYPEGNCLSLALEPGDPSKCIYHVVNMHAENFHYICKFLGLQRVRTRLASDVSHGMFILIIDPRIPRDWFLRVPCRCTGALGQQLVAEYPEWFRAR